MSDHPIPPSPSTESVTLHTSDDVELEGQWALPTDIAHVVILCHPHPLYGGNMFAGVVDGLFRSLPRQGLACLRFNFRGVGGSGGNHDKGGAERLDVLSALETALARFPDLPVTLGGWSFGADVSLAVDDARHAGWLSVAPPLAVVPVVDMAAPQDPRPKRLIVPENDQYNPPPSAREKTSTWLATSIDVVNGADHFLHGHQHEVDRLALAGLD